MIVAISLNKNSGAISDTVLIISERVSNVTSLRREWIFLEYQYTGDVERSVVFEL